MGHYFAGLLKAFYYLSPFFAATVARSALTHGNDECSRLYANAKSNDVPNASEPSAADDARKPQKGLRRSHDQIPQKQQGARANKRLPTAGSQSQRPFDETDMHDADVDAQRPVYVALPPVVNDRMGEGFCVCHRIPVKLTSMRSHCCRRNF